MKHMKKLVTLLLALIMALALVVPSAAATVENATGHAYDAYQIFSGTQEADSAALGGIVWGTGINGDAFLAALKADPRFDVDGANIFAACTNAAAVAAVLAENNTSVMAETFANVAAQHLTATVTAAIAADASNVELPTGYYLLVDTSEPDVGDARNSALLQVTNSGNITIAKKYDVPTVDKSVMDSDGTWGEAADWSYTSNVPFQLVGTLPSNYDDYETYYYNFVDTMTKHFTFNNDVKVYVRNTDSEDDDILLSSDLYTVTAEAVMKDGTQISLGEGFEVGETTQVELRVATKLQITFANLKGISAINKDSKIIVRYSALLDNDGVTVGKKETDYNDDKGIYNKVYLEYSSDPNASGDGTSKTLEDLVRVYTYMVKVTKVDGADNSKKLAGAAFKLKCVEGSNAGKWYLHDQSHAKIAGWTDNEEDASIRSTSSSGGLNYVCLDAGTYELYEVTAPAGYSVLEEPVRFTITADLDKGENTPSLNSVSITVDGQTAEGKLTSGQVALTVENNVGASLPETGGVGTTLFYSIGGMLMVGAAVLLVTRKRMNNAK